MEPPELPCFVVNLDDRPDKWNETKASFKGTGIRLQRFSAIRDKKGWIGCAKSHVALAAAALEKEYPWILVLEDDCEPADDFVKRWPRIQKRLWANRDAWDIFLGGATYVDGPATKLDSDLIQIGQGFSTHFYVLNSRVYKKVLEWNSSEGAIDTYFSRKLRIVTTLPALATQRPGKSDIEPVAVDYNGDFRKAELRLRELVERSQMRAPITLLLVLSVIGGLWALNANPALRKQLNGKAL